MHEQTRGKQGQAVLKLTWNCRSYLRHHLMHLALFISRHAMITRAPRLAKSIAVSLPMPVLAPVMRTVLSSILASLVQTPPPK